MKGIRLGRHGSIALLATLALLSAGTLITSCRNNGSADSLDAAGATFPLPYYNVIFKKYQEQKGVRINYGALGSGGGIRSLTDRVVDFAATDAFLTDDEMSALPAIVHIPTCMGAVVVAYNLPEASGLKLTGALIADIYLGRITMWNDPAIKAINEGISLPNKKISPVYRADGSGTTNVFSNYLSKVSEEWQNSVGSGKSLKWPIGLAAKGNPGVAGVIKQTDGAIGYIGSEYSFSLGMPTAAILNRAGNYINPSLESISAAAEGDLPADTRTMITDADGANAYPISCLTWLILYKEQKYDKRSVEKAQATVDFVRWMLGDEAQKETTNVHFAPLPAQLKANALAQIESVTYDGKPLSSSEKAK